MNQIILKKYSSLALAKYRNKYGLFLVEGGHLVEELLKSDWEIESIISSKRDIENNRPFLDITTKIEIVGQTVINKIATTKNPQDILAVVKIPEKPETSISRYNRIIIADRIKDPGNMGTIIRTAKAFNFDLVITTTDSTDIFSPKVVRATQGAIFGIRTLTNINSDTIISELRSQHKLYALARDGSLDLNDIKQDDKHVLIIGTEIEGVSKLFLDNSDYHVRIPHSDSVESLNAAVAAGIAMYHFSRRNHK